LNYRKLEARDSAAVQRVVLDCPPLTLHTPYTYWVILSRSADLCVGAFEDGDLIAMALTIPTLNGRAFVWQIAVRAQFRGRRISHHLLEQVWQAAKHAGLDSLEATIGSDNKASAAAFSAFAESKGLALQAVGNATPCDADSSVVDPEIEYRIYLP